MKISLIALALTMVSASVMASSDHIDHSKMDHSKMDHSTMNHASMGHSKMDHSNMDMEGMSAVGMPATGAKPDKVIHVVLSDDMKIEFKRDVKIEPNDIVQFVVMNTGKVNHKFVIGSPNEQHEHREMMTNISGDHTHDSGNAVTVGPGKAKQLLWHFHGESEIEFACNIPGHAEAGMVKKIDL
ncbi:copper-resistant cuproprotein CopI [Vibrio sp. WXL103]|uniref:copper-resistant cuproprotein CopI n=1 Tax=Vibrio sp. WXL103 TaxID=3450710 RepID=UPI003EC68BAB